MKQINEQFISRIVRSAFTLYLAATIAALIAWLFSDLKPFRFYSLYFDLTGLVFLNVIAILSNVIIHFSRRYMHNDPGYRRFFLILTMFTGGMTMICTAGDFILLFAGWEIVGLSSYLLIGFYWHRPQAILNANRAYYIYRFCDLGILASALISEVIWHDHQIFHQHWLSVPLLEQWALSLVILLPVLGKSAQFPFSYWLPRAMEGPTPSSAIFYGALSIHAGVFLLMRTFPIWHTTPGFPWVVGAIGAITAILASLSSRVQTNVKGQIGYASITHVGIMLMELALGFRMLALAHLVFNAFFRCFQLLTSLCVQADQLHVHHALDGKRLNFWRPRSRTLYVLALNESYLEALTLQIIKPFRYFLRYYGSLNQVVLCQIGVALLFWPRLIWGYIFGVLAGWILAAEALAYVQRHDQISFGRFPWASTLVLIGFLGIIGFPLSVTFVGEDLLTEQALQHGFWFLLLFNLIFVINGIALIRLYSRIFLGNRDYDSIPSSDRTPMQTTWRLAAYGCANLAIWFTFWG